MRHHSHNPFLVHTPRFCTEPLFYFNTIYVRGKEYKEFKSFRSAYNSFVIGPVTFACTPVTPALLFS